MAHGLRPTTEQAQPRARALFKADCPRDIDRHIAFFGNEDAAARDMCGEALLDALTGGSGENDAVSSCT
jgi:hypothetical protein